MQKISPVTTDIRRPAIQPHLTQVMKDNVRPHKKVSALPMIIFCFLIVAGGIGTGWILAGGSEKTSANINIPGITQTSGEAGVQDESSFDAKALEGVIEEGGVSGEGTHHLVREGGKSQYIYLTSSVIDLQSYVGKNVQLWGSWMSAKNPMVDVGKIKVLK